MELSTSLRAGILAQLRAYPKMEITDLYKFLYQGARGCEHLAPSPADATARILAEHAAWQPAERGGCEPLSDRYSRVPLSYLDAGLSAEVLAALLCRSARHEPSGEARLSEGLALAREMIVAGELPFSADAFDKSLAAWQEAGYPAVHHSATFRHCYRPAYRVIANEYVRLLPLLTAIGRALEGGRVLLALEGGAASGKTTLAALLAELYGATVVHTDDFFLQPAQRTPARLAEVGGNLDRERFLDEVLLPLHSGQTVCYRRFDCKTQKILPATELTPACLTVVEGSYSMHPTLAPYYTLSAFLDIDPAYQHERILVRNPGAYAERFFREWIPMEQAYFEGMRVKERCDLVIPIEKPTV